MLLLKLHGMFLLSSWVNGTRNEKVPAEKANISATRQPPLPMMTHVSLSNKMKRKREDSASLMSPHDDRNAAKRNAGQTNQGRSPALEGNGLSTASNKQRDGHYTWIDESSMIPAGNRGAKEWEDGRKGGICENESPKESSSHAKARQQEHATRATDLEHVLPDATSKATLQQTIESQFSLEILLKHRELRLIDQELAKCQAALEQLRRCQIIPYPAMTSAVEDMEAVSSGSGLTLETRVQHPPPWGVDNGPYTRHYDKWLLLDGAFDVNAAEPSRPPQTAGKAVPERSTRGSVSEKNVFTSASRSQRGSNNARLQALPHGYPEPKEDKGPMILQRSTDGQMVKLVCLDCGRDNFNSAQGFINHCRIAHNRGFASHDAAAIACGEELEVNSAGGVIGELSVTTSASAGLVHPLIRSAHVARSTPTHSTSSSSSSSRRKKSTSNTQTMNSVTTQPSGPPPAFSAFSTPKPDRNRAELKDNTSSAFTPSSQTPHLSALLARRGHRGDLAEMVNEAKTKPDTDNDPDPSSEDEDEDMNDLTEPPMDAQSHGSRGVIRGGRLPARAGMSPAPLERVLTNKGIRGSRKPEFLPHINPRAMYSSPYPASASDEATANSLHSESALIDTSTTLNLSPNTIESHPAPSLVSDDGDYENTHSESESPSSAEDDEDEGRYLDIEVEDHDHIATLEGSASAATDHLGLAGSVKPHSPAARRSSALRSPTAIRPGTANVRNVSFASPGRRSRGSVKKWSA